MGKIIAIANMKGGVAKTTTTANVGAILAQKGYKVLLVDLDAQANLTTYYLGEEPKRTIYNAMVEESPLPILSLSPNLDIVPSSIEMSGIESKVVESLDKLEILKDLLEPVQKEYNFILLDCPPSLELGTINALVTATDLYIPLSAEAIPIRGLKVILDFVAKVKKRKNPYLNFSGIIITRWEGTTLNRDLEKGLRGKYGEIVFNTRIRKNVAIQEAPTQFKDIVSYSPQSNGALDYLSLTEEIIQRNK